MKTAAKLCMTALATVLGVGLVSVSGVHAQAPAPEPSPITTSVPGPVTAVPHVPPPSSIELSTPSDSKEKLKGRGAKEDEAATSPKVPDSVQNVVKRLNTATQDVTLEDLNAAREAVVKLDVLIDIEKRLNDLSTLRKEREEKDTSSISAALPASALDIGRPPAAASMAIPSMPIGALPTNFPSMDATALNIPRPSPSLGAVDAPLGSVDVKRVVGARGSYSAIIKDGGQTKTVHKGDKLSDGSQVDSISRSGVTISRDKKSKTIQVKDVAQVFGEQ